MKNLGNESYVATRSEIRSMLKDMRDNGYYCEESIYIAYKDKTCFFVGHNEVEKLPYFSIQNIQYVHIIDANGEVVYGTEVC